MDPTSLGTVTKRPPSSREAPEIEPLDVDGVRTVALLTVLWGVAFVVLAIRRDALEADGNGWWLWTCLAGVGLGMLGMEYTRRRRDAIAHAKLLEEAEDDDAEPVNEPLTGHDDEADTSPELPRVDTANHPVVNTSDNVTRPIETTAPPQARPGLRPGPGTEPALPRVPDRQPTTGQQPPMRDVQPPARDIDMPKRHVESPLPNVKRPANRPSTEHPAPGGAEQGPLTSGAFPRVGDTQPAPGTDTDLVGPDYRPRRARSTPAPPPPPPDDEPLLETTLGGGQRSQQPDPDDAGDDDEPGYRGRRRRDSA